MEECKHKEKPEVERWVILCRFGLHKYTGWEDDGTFTFGYYTFYRQKNTCSNCKKIKTRKINMEW